MPQQRPVPSPSTAHEFDQLVDTPTALLMPMTVTGIVSNHPRTTLAHSEHARIPYHHFPITRDSKAEQEERIKRVIEETGSELVVLARYMQVLSDAVCQRMSGRIINIHHSFLPSFKGANPYKQAFERGFQSFHRSPVLSPSMAASISRRTSSLRVSLLSKRISRGSAAAEESVTGPANWDISSDSERSSCATDKLATP